MITKPTTLILGAGASASFGFPTGYHLKQLVLARNSLMDYPGYDKMLLALGESWDSFQRFCEALHKSGQRSVDSFLENRPEFVSVGKIAIATVLIGYESEMHLFKHDGKSWYDYLFDQLRAPFTDFGKNKLSILTFNYDRSFEHFLFTALKNAYGKHGQEAAEKLSEIPIVHLHGDLGELPCFSKEEGRLYDTNLSPDTLRVAAKRIKIIHEGLAEQPQFVQAKKLLSESDIICFLGFGYHPLNMERLDFKKTILPPFSTYSARQVIGSSFQLTYRECLDLERLYPISLHSGHAPYRQCETLQFLRETGVFLGN